MANRLQRIMAMDQMMQNRNMPQQGMQSVFNPTTGTFVNVPFQTDPNFKGRRTVMTPSGPQALPGFQGQENPYRALGRGARNLLGNLFGRGQRRRQNRKADQSLQSQEEILRERYRQAGPDGQMNTDDDILPELVTKAATASPVVVKDGKGEITFTQERFPGVFKEAGSYENRIKQLMENQGINRGEAERNQAEAIKKGMDLDNSGYVDDSEAFAFNNPTTAGQPLEIPAFRSGREEKLREIEERINRPIMRGPAPLPTFDISQMSRGQVKYGDPKTFTLPNGDLAVSRTVTKGNQSGLEIIDPSSGRVIFSNAPGTTSSKTSSATPQANPFAKKMDREIDFDAAILLPKDEQEKYLDPNISDAEFKKLNKKAKVLLAKTPKKEKPTEGMLNSKTAFTQMTLAAPTLKRLEQNAKLMEQLGGFSGAMARNFRSMADPDERLYLQAADAWIRAKLRKESGAAIGEKEMEQEYATFFPQLNDTSETIAEKARQREVLTRQMGINAGEIKETKQDKKQIPEAQKDYDASNALTITTQKEYDALPSGATYLENGQEFRKP